MEWHGDEVGDRVHDAARHIDMERLAISPQCGFATSILGNALGPGDELAKLQTLAQTARVLWG